MTQITDEQPHIYWVDEDRPFVGTALFYFGRKKFKVIHFPDASVAYDFLKKRGNLGRGVLIVDVMLAAGDDENLFKADQSFEEEQMGLLLVERLSDAWLKPAEYPLIVYSARMDTAFKTRVERYCEEKNLEFVPKSADIDAEDFCNLVIERFQRFKWH